MSTPTPLQIRSLYRSMLRASSQFASYNFREYFLQRTKDKFRQPFSESNDNHSIPLFYENAQKELKVLQRQSIINSMYGGQKLVIESPKIQKFNRKKTQIKGSPNEPMERSDS